MTLPRFTDAEEWFLVLFAAKSMQSTPLLDQDNNDLSENNSSSPDEDNLPSESSDLSTSKTSLEYTLSNIREIEPLTLQEAKAMADERFIETLLVQVDQVSIEMKKKLESLQDEIVVHEQEYKSLVIQEVSMVANCFIFNFVESSLFFICFAIFTIWSFLHLNICMSSTEYCFATTSRS